jgi:hypothetical protein
MTEGLYVKLCQIIGSKDVFQNLPNSSVIVQYLKLKRDSNYIFFIHLISIF